MASGQATLPLEHAHDPQGGDTPGCQGAPVNRGDHPERPRRGVPVQHKQYRRVAWRYHAAEQAQAWGRVAMAVCHGDLHTNADGTAHHQGQHSASAGHAPPDP